MASKRQNEANRENAKCSTGPKSLAGKAASSQNGRRHGLTVASEAMDEHAERLFSAVEHLFGQRIQGEETVAANAQINLWRIRNARTEMLLALLDEPSPARMKRIMNLERYERTARGKRRRVLKFLKTSER